MRVPALDVTEVIELGKRLIRNFSEHRMATFAAALAYRGLFSLFPFMLILVVLVGAVGSPNSPDQLIEEVKPKSSEQLPRQLQPVVEQSREQIQPLEEIVEQAQKQAGGELLLFSIALAMWSVSALASTLADAFNIAYGVPEARRGWKKLALSLASGPVVALAVIVASGLMLTGPQVAERVAEEVGLRDLFVLLWGWLRYPVALVLLWVALSFVYRYGSAARQRFGSVMLVAVVAWAITSVGFSIYLANFADYGVTYGSLGAAVGLLFYLNLSASIVLVGAEIIAAIQRPVKDRPIQAGKPDPDQEIPDTLDRRSIDA
jgi:membrane protein